MKQLCIDLLKKRNVELEDIAECTYILQEKYIDGLTKEMCLEAVESVLGKREVQNAIMTGVFMDEAAEKGLVEEPLKSKLLSDDGLYGIDEVLEQELTTKPKRNKKMEVLCNG